MSAPSKESIHRSVKRLWRNYIWNARRRNFFWDVSLEDFHALTSHRCHYCGREPTQKSRSYIYNGLDRINGRQGYVLGNLVACCKECNWIKGVILTHDEMMAVAKALKDFRAKKREKK